MNSSIHSMRLSSWSPSVNTWLGKIGIGVDTTEEWSNSWDKMEGVLTSVDVSGSLWFSVHAMDDIEMCKNT